MQDCIEKRLERLEDKIDKLSEDVAKLKVHASFWGVSGAALVVLISKLIG